ARTARANLRAIPLRWQRIAVLLRFLVHLFRCELSGTVLRPGLADACVLSRRWRGLYGMRANTGWVPWGGVSAWFERGFAREALEGERIPNPQLCAGVDSIYSLLCIGFRLSILQILTRRNYLEFSNKH